MENYGNRIKEARKAANLTQLAAANKAGVTQQVWQRYESGKLDLKMSSIYNICQALDISADWLLGLREEENPIQEFYVAVTDVICDYAEEEEIEDEVSYRLTREIERIYHDYD